MASSVKDMLAAANSAVPRIQPADLRDRMSKGDVVVVDVVTRLSWLPAARSKAQFTCRAACWSSVPTPKAHTTIPLLGRRRPSSSIAHQAGARRSPEKRCKSLATSRSTMRAPSRIWRKRVWRQSQLRSSRSAKAFGQLLARPMCAGKLARAKSSRAVLSDRKHRTRPLCCRRPPFRAKD
jgi:hypothetical protein